MEFIHAVLLLCTVHLVDGQQHRLLAAPQDICYLGVEIGDAGSHLNHKDYQIALFYCDENLAADGTFENVIAVHGETACVHHAEFVAAPFALAVVTVARHARDIVHDGLPHPHQTVEEGAFADIRPTYYRY